MARPKIFGKKPKRRKPKENKSIKSAGINAGDDRSTKVVFSSKILKNFLEGVMKIMKYPNNTPLTMEERRMTLRSSRIRMLLYTKPPYHNILRSRICSNKVEEVVVVEKVCQKFELSCKQNTPFNCEGMPWISCEFDAIFYKHTDVAAIIEFKSVKYSSFQRYMKKDMSAMVKGTEYYIQLQIQLRVSKLKFGIICFFIKDYIELNKPRNVPVVVSFNPGAFEKTSKKIKDKYLNFVIPANLINPKRAKGNLLTTRERREIFEQFNLNYESDIPFMDTPGVFNTKGISNNEKLIKKIKNTI